MSIAGSVAIVAGGQTAKLISKTIAEALLGNDSALVDAVSGSSADLTKMLGERIRQAGLRGRARKRLLQDPTPLCLLALVMVELIQETSDHDIVSSFGLAADSIRQRLDYLWANDALGDSRGNRLARHVNSYSDTMALDDKLTAAIGDRFAQAAWEEIQDEEFCTLQNDDPAIAGFFSALAAKIPPRLERLYLAVPGIVERLTLSAAQSADSTGRRILGLLDGTAAADEAQSQLLKYAQEIIAWGRNDVFGRDHAGANQPGLMALEDVYVEPLVAIDDQLQPVRAAIRNAWSTAPNSLVVTVAPFGMGKSLTSKSLVIDLMHEWFKSEDAPFPLFLHAPVLLRGMVRTLEDAVFDVLRNQMGLTRDAAQVVWERFPLTLVIDSFDEVVLSGRSRRLWIEEMQKVAANPRFRVMLASRPTVISRHWLEEASGTWFELQPFSQAQVGEWLQVTKGAVHVGDVSASELVARLGDELAGTPILLLMAAWVWKSSPERKTASKTSLYSDFIARIASGKWEGVQEGHPAVLAGQGLLDGLAGEGAFKRSLALLAWEQAKRVESSPDPDEPDGLTLHDVSELVRERFVSATGGALSDSQVEEVTDSMVLSMFINLSSDRDVIRFSHRSFREYLCARHWVDCLQEGGDGLCSPARVRLYEIELGGEELQHIEALCSDSADRRKALNVADSVYTDERMVWFQHQDKVTMGQVEAGPSGVTRRDVLIAAPRQDERATRGARNGSVLGAHLRDYPPDLIKVLSGWYPVQWERCLFADAVRLFPHFPWYRSRGREIGPPSGLLGYKTESGAIFWVPMTHWSSPETGTEHPWFIHAEYTQGRWSAHRAHRFIWCGRRHLIDLKPTDDTQSPRIDRLSRMNALLSLAETWACAAASGLRPFNSRRAWWLQGADGIWRTAFLGSPAVDALGEQDSRSHRALYQAAADIAFDTRTLGQRAAYARLSEQSRGADIRALYVRLMLALAGDWSQPFTVISASGESSNGAMGTWDGLLSDLLCLVTWLRQVEPDDSAPATALELTVR